MLLYCCAPSTALLLVNYLVTGSGNVDFQEYLALVFYFQELEYQYNSYLGMCNSGNTLCCLLFFFVFTFCTPGNVRDYSWLTPLLGSENTQRIPVVARKLQEWKLQKHTPSYDEFVDLIGIVVAS